MNKDSNRRPRKTKTTTTENTENAEKTQNTENTGNTESTETTKTTETTPSPTGKVIPFRTAAAGAGPEESSKATASDPLHPSDLALARAIKDRLDGEGQHVVHSEGQFHAWVGTHWSVVDAKQQREWVAPFDGMSTGPSTTLKLNSGKIRGVLHEFEVLVSDPTFFDDDVPRGINAGNGFIAFDANGRPHLEAHAPEHRQRFVLAARWEPGVRPRCELLRTLIAGCLRDDPAWLEKTRLLAEIGGAVVAGLGTALRQPKAAVFVGQANAGKSQIIDAVERLVPPDAIATVAATNFGRDRYLIRLAGVVLNVAAELAGGDTVATDRFKAVVTGDRVSARDPYKQSVSFRPRAQHIFATNELPEFKGGMSPPVTRRLLVFPCLRVIPADERIAGLGQRVAAEEMDALLWFCVKGASRLLRRGSFMDARSSRVAIEEWMHDADAVIDFLDDPEWVRLDPGASAPSTATWQAFKARCAAQGTKSVSQKAFVRRVLSSGRGISKLPRSDLRYLSGLRLVAGPEASQAS